ncbi:IS66-like element accessory protein TnpA [Acidisoma sp. 7E03]
MFNDKSPMVVLPRGEVCSNRRRRWSEVDKGRIVAESFEQGRTTSEVARRHDVTPQQLFEWRRQARRGELAVPVADEMPFAEVEIGLEEQAPAAPQVRDELELLIGRVTIRVTDRTDLGLLTKVVQALRGIAA